MMIFPRLIKEEYIINFFDNSIWIQRLSFMINNRLRSSILENHTIYNIRDTFRKYLKIKRRAKLFYVYLNSKKPIEERKTPDEINKDFNKIKQDIKNNLLSIQKHIYLLEIPKGIQKIKDKVEETKQYFVKNLTELPPEICKYILTFVFIW